MSAAMLSGCAKFKGFWAVNLKARQNFKIQVRKISATEF